MAETKTITSISKHNGTDERYYRVHFSDNSTETVWEAGNRMDALQRLMKSAFKAEREMLGGRYTNYVPIVVEQPTNASTPTATQDKRADNGGSSAVARGSVKKSFKRNQKVWVKRGNSTTDYSDSKNWIWGYFKSQRNNVVHVEVGSDNYFAECHNHISDVFTEAEYQAMIAATSEPAAAQTADAAVSFAVGDYVRFATENNDTGYGTITNISLNSYTIEEDDNIVQVRSLSDIFEKIVISKTVSPFMIGDVVRYKEVQKKRGKKQPNRTGSAIVEATNGTSSHIRFPGHYRALNVGNAALELVERPQSAAQTPPAAHEAGTGDVSHAGEDDEYGEPSPELIAQIQKARQFADAIGAVESGELDAKDATIAKLQADNDMLRAVLQNIANNAPQSESTINYGNAHAIAWAFWVAGVNAKSVLVIIEREEAID